MHATTRTNRNRSILETVLKRDKALVIAGLAAVTLLAWAYLFYLAQGMGDMAAMPGSAISGMEGVEMTGAARTVAWGPVDFVLMFLMWAVMMVGMMVPSAAPMILAFANINRLRRLKGNPYVPTVVFLAGYVLVWSAFSVAATGLQWGLRYTSLLSPMMVSASPILGGILLLAAGAFQWSPLKSVCLRHCQTPMGYITNEWREGHRGALAMGVHHGAYCLGCCWALMGLLFVLGVMNLLWIAALAALVLGEKVLPAGQWLGRVAGLGFLAWGCWLMAGTFL